MYITAGLQFSELTVEVNNAGKSWASYAIKSSIGDGELGLTCSLGFLRNYRPRVCFPRVTENICLAEALDAKDFTKQNHKKKMQDHVLSRRSFVSACFRKFDPRSAQVSILSSIVIIDYQKIRITLEFD